MNGPAGPTAPPSLRVILIGETDLERQFTRDPRVDMQRAPTTLQALSFLAMDHASGPRAIVLGAIDLSSDEQRRFVSSIRTVAPTARVFAPLRDSEWPTELIDAIVDTPDDLFAEPAPPPASPVEAPTEPRAEAGRADLLPHLAESLLGGVALDDLLIEHLRRAAAIPSFDIVRVPAEIPPGHASAPVTRGGATLAYVTASPSHAAELSALATAIAPWLALQAQQEQLRDAAFHDHLTGALNRRAFELALDRALERARDARRPVSLLLFDVDDFKSFNERAGHRAGDEVLGYVVAIFKSLVRPSDRVCRIGGDEFAVIFDDPSGPRVPGSQHPRSTEDIVERIHEASHARRPPDLDHAGDAPLRICSAIATYPWDGRTRQELVQAADRRLCASKRDGSNHIQLLPLAQP